MATSTSLGNIRAFRVVQTLPEYREHCTVDGADSYLRAQQIRDHLTYPNNDCELPYSDRDPSVSRSPWAVIQPLYGDDRQTYDEIMGLPAPWKDR